MFLEDFSQETAKFLIVSKSLDFRITSEPGVEVSRQFYSSAQETYFSKADQYSWREKLSYMYRRDKCTDFVDLRGTSTRNQLG
jgi:hypothetical protein